MRVQLNTCPKHDSVKFWHLANINEEKKVADNLEVFFSNSKETAKFQEIEFEFKLVVRLNSLLRYFFKVIFKYNYSCQTVISNL